MWNWMQMMRLLNIMADDAEDPDKFEVIPVVVVVVDEAESRLVFGAVFTDVDIATDTDEVGGGGAGVERGTTVIALLVVPSITMKEKAWLDVAEAGSNVAVAFDNWEVENMPSGYELEDCRDGDAEIELMDGEM
ncbi:hypothetical protein EYC84_008841 [Monilinia fructicola]|uniref:Uncharacterized protein n=1 Tax=Monilinia fructicola TaxID=38448 RepID=A0A5M9JAH1_MONFR|nr:hypothetical protein EYC84_008841 [Monilinia fructicola]